MCMVGGTRTCQSRRPPRVQALCRATVQLCVALPVRQPRHVITLLAKHWPWTHAPPWRMCRAPVHQRAPCVTLVRHCCASFSDRCTVTAHDRTASAPTEAPASTRALPWCTNCRLVHAQMRHPAHRAHCRRMLAADMRPQTHECATRARHGATVCHWHGSVCHSAGTVRLCAHDHRTGASCGAPLRD